jgi:RNA polymerase primary sigma factor
MYLPAVIDVAKIYAGQGVLLEDLIGEGNLALAFGAGMLGSLESPAEADGMLGKMIMDAMEDYIQEHAANEKADLKIADKVNKVTEKASCYLRDAFTYSFGVFPECFLNSRLK